MTTVDRYDAERKFVDAMRQHGLTLGLKNLVADGEFHRCNVAAKGGVAGTYNGKEKRAAFERWAAHIAGIVTGKTAKVVPLPKRGVS